MALFSHFWPFSDAGKWRFGQSFDFQQVFLDFLMNFHTKSAQNFCIDSLWFVVDHKTTLGQFPGYSSGQKYEKVESAAFLAVSTYCGGHIGILDFYRSLSWRLTICLWQVVVERRPLFGTAGWWWGKNGHFWPTANLTGGFKKCFFMVGKSEISAFRNFFHK